MIVDRRKDHYDELLVLARDARVSRARTNRWTTGLVVAAMAAGGAYVAATNNEVEELRDAKEAADAEAFRLTIDMGRLQGQHAALLAERDAYKVNAEWFASLSPSLLATNRLGDISNAIGGGGSGDDSGRGGVPDFAVSNLVWYVDGSRRFPMAANDILWIPEGQFWVKLEPPASEGSVPTDVTIHFGDRPVNAPDLPDQRAAPDSAAQPAGSLGPFRLGNNRYYERTVSRGNTNCVKIELDNRTERPVFGTRYVDMVVTYTSNSNCANRLVSPTNSVPE